MYSEAPVDISATSPAGASLPYGHLPPLPSLPRLRAEEGDGSDGDDRAEFGEGETTEPGGEAGRVLRRRLDLQDEAVQRLRAELQATADRLAEVLRGYIEGRAGGTDSARVRAAIYQTRLEDVLALLEANGLADAEDEWYGRYARLAAEAEQQLAAAGVAGADRALDSEGAQAAIAATVEADRDEFWQGSVERPAAERILRGLRTSIEAQPLDEVCRIIARDEGVTLPQAANTAVTRIAEYDRFVNAEAARQADPEGETLFWAYTGPDDGIERPFCDQINGRFFTREQVARLDNHQPGTGHPMVSGGGWRCRHQWVHGPAAFLERLGYRRGSDADIDAANAAAAGRRR